MCNEKTLASVVIEQFDKMSNNPNSAIKVYGIESVKQAVEVLINLKGYVEWDVFNQADVRDENGDEFVICVSNLPVDIKTPGEYDIFLAKKPLRIIYNPEEFGIHTINFTIKDDGEFVVHCEKATDSALICNLLSVAETMVRLYGN